MENLYEQELVNFTQAERFEILLDAGCGTGVNILRLYSRVRKIIGIDYAFGSLQRCQKRIQAQKITNAYLCLGSVTTIPLPDCSVDRVLCLSVLQYLDDEEARLALREAVRVLTPGGMIILHVKNSSSLYWSTLRLAKQLKACLGGSTRIEYLRPFRWYVDELTSLNCDILDYNSLNLLVLEGMPKRVLSVLQRFELRYHDSPLFRSPFIRRHGAELKIKARLVAGPLEPERSETKTVARLSR
jgi:SAM-dependent methyltransferase